MILREEATAHLQDVKPDQAVHGYPTNLDTSIPNSPLLACRVCGLIQSAPPWGADGRQPTFDFCDCCGVELGYGDATPEAARRYRAQWEARGKTWFKPKTRPAHWSADEQMKNIPAEFQ
jgi:hypothetical protein